MPVAPTEPNHYDPHWEAAQVWAKSCPRKLQIVELYFHVVQIAEVVASTMPRVEAALAWIEKQQQQPQGEVNTNES